MTTVISIKVEPGGSYSWSSLQLLANGKTLPPSNGDTWKMFLGMFQKFMSGGKEIIPHPAWSLNSHGVYDTHLPDKWSCESLFSNSYQVHIYSLAYAFHTNLLLTKMQKASTYLRPESGLRSMIPNQCLYPSYYSIFQ